jgi:L-cysteine desulfidase
MNIIFGDSVDSIPDHYTVLELDTFRPADSNKTMTAYCLVEKLALDEFVTLEHYKQIHVDIIKYYKQKHWDYCEQAIQGLMGKWGGELDTFYTDLLNRVKQNKQNGVPEDWNATLIKG